MRFMSESLCMSTKTQSNQALVSRLLEQDTPVGFRAGGPSMTPTLRDGDRVRVRPLASGDLRRGAICLYRKNGRLVLHRLVRKNEMLFFCGDAALEGLEAVDSGDVLGIATMVERAGKSVALDTPFARRRGLLRYRLRPLRRRLIQTLKGGKAE